MAKFIIGDWTFDSKKAALEKIKTILQKSAINTHLDRESSSLLQSILELHPSKKEKIGCGVKAFKVKQNPVWTHQRSFYIVRNDDSEIDFSYIRCFEKRSQKQEFIIAARYAIDPFIFSFKQKYFDDCGGVSVCPFTGQTIEFVGAHVDHKIPKTFKNLLQDFIDKFAIDINATEIVEAEDGVRSLFADKAIEQSWVDFHNANADLQVVSALANLTVLKDGWKKRSA